MTDMDDRPFISRLFFPDGDEPDPRFTLANEGNFLAVTRTSLAFLAGGIALEAFPVEYMDKGVRTTLAVFIIAVGMVVITAGAVRWFRVERAMRHDRPLPTSTAAPLLALAMLITSGVAVWLFIFA